MPASVGTAPAVSPRCSTVHALRGPTPALPVRPLPAGHSLHPDHATPFPVGSEETLSRRRARPSHPDTRRLLTSPRPREAGRAQAGARRCPVRAPVRPTCARAAAANARESRDAQARHRRCTGAGSRAPMHARVQSCSYPAHAHCSCCSRRRHRRAEQRAPPPPPCPARPAPAPRARPTVPAPSRPVAAPASAAAAAAVNSNSKPALGANAASPRRTRRAAMQITPESPPLSRFAPPPPWA